MISIKRGDTFAFYAEIENELGTPLVTDVANLKSQIRDTSYNLITDLDISTTSQEGQYLFTAPSTDSWPVQAWGESTLLMDIEMNVEGQITSSETIKIQVIKDVTYNG